MKTIIALIIPVLLMLSSFVNVLAQDVTFTYDPNGNREDRIIDLGKSTDSIGDFNKNVIDKSNDNDEDSLPKIYSESIEDCKVKIYPNPSGGRFKVKIEGLSETVSGSLLLTTLSGTIVFEDYTVKSETFVDIRNHDSGTYILSIMIDQQKRTWKVIKR